MLKCVSVGLRFYCAYRIEKEITHRNNRNGFWGSPANEDGAKPLDANSVLTRPKAL